MRTCECGCGEPVKAHKRFVHGHNARGSTHPSWAGGATRHALGYRQVRAPEHPRANNGYVLEHVLVAERALGRPLPAAHPVHHVNEDRADNRPENLVVCQDNAYHKLIHYRTEALRRSGNAGHIRCEVCHNYDAPERMYVSPTRALRAYHPECAARRNRERHQQRRAAQ